MDLLFAANAICHVPDLQDLAEAVKILLKDKGVWVFEEPYAGEMLRKTAYDQIYDEHVYLFSAHSIQNAAARFKLELWDVEEIPTHGGSLRYFVSRPGTFSKTNRLQEILLQE